MTEDDTVILLEQLRLLGESEYHVIYSGNKPFDGLVEYHGAEVSTHPPELKRATIETGGVTLHLYRA